MPSNLETAKKAYELFQKGDAATMIRDIVDDNCRWIEPGPPDKLPWAGSFKGKQEIGAFFMRLAENVEFTEYKVGDMIEKGDTIVVLGSLAGRVRKTGKTVKSDWVHVGKYSPQGKLVFFQQYIDTASGVAAVS